VSVPDGLSPAGEANCSICWDLLRYSCARSPADESPLANGFAVSEAAGAEQELLQGVGEIGHRHLVVVASRRQQRSLGGEAGQVSAGHAGRRGRQRVQGRRRCRAASIRFAPPGSCAARWGPALGPRPAGRTVPGAMCDPTSEHWEWMRAGRSVRRGRRPPRLTAEPCWRGLVVVAVAEDGANYAIAGVLWRVAARLRIAVSTTSGWESIGTWLLSTA
jgi:hypothetical protein